MLIDRESFVPGQSREKTEIEFKLNRDELKANFVNVTGCPFFLAFKRVGVPVKSVGVFSWVDTNCKSHGVSSDIVKAMCRLASTNGNRFTRWTRQFYFRNKTFTVKF